MSSPNTQDSRGAALVAGVFMAAVLAGGLFFLAGIGRALVQREALQDGADAVAFTSAVYHARGMNLVALLNVLPAAIILVLIGVKVIHGIAYVMRVAECTYGGPACDAARSMEDAAIAIERNVFPRAHEMLENLYLSQNAVAVGMPWIAEARASRAAAASGGPTSFGVAIGPSLVGKRTSFLDPYEAEAAMERVPPALRDVGAWPGLPLADAGADPDAEWAVACRKNVDLLDMLVRQVIARYGVPITPSTQFVFESLASGGLCGEGINKDIFTAVDIDGERRIAQRAYRAPKKVVPGLRLGSDAFAVWSVAAGHSQVTTGVDRGVEVAGQGARKLPELPRVFDIQVAKAEYYYEPPNPGATWASVEPVAMWNLRWRARLRRVRPPEPEVREAMARAVALDVAAFADARRGPSSAAGAAIARAEGVRLLDAWFAAGAAGTTPESMNAWLGAREGVVRPSEIVIVH